MEFIETTRFTKLIPDYFTDEEYAGFQHFLLLYPESGKIVRGSGGIRKVRWDAAGRGKSGGVRVIYYYKKTNGEIWLLTIYRKSEVGTISTQLLQQIAKEIEDDKT